MKKLVMKGCEKMQEFNINLKKRRLELGLTLKNVADIVGVTESTVRKWEVGIIANMKKNKLEKLANALQTTIPYILGLEDNEDKKTSKIINKYIELENLVKSEKEKEDILEEILKNMELIKIKIKNRNGE